MKISHAEVYPSGSQLGRVAAPMTVSGSRTRGSEASAAQIARSQRRRLQELAQENYKDVKIEIPPSFVKGGLRPGRTVNTRRVLASKKTVANVFDDDPAAADAYMELAAASSKYPSLRVCSVCGFTAKTTCLRCGAKHCSLRCGKLHTERCQ